MTDIPDAELLAQFARTESEAAFAELVRRDIALVHSVALRHTDNPQSAQEITQAVFIILARKAASLGRKVVLSGWLYHTARLTAANFRRAEHSRVRREQEAYMQSTLEENSPDAAWLELSPLLDDAMARLGATDRDAVVLRYFENKSLSEVGAALGLEERAAQKRVLRALEKLRRIFTQRGVALTATLIAGAVSANSVQAVPAGLAVAVTATAAKGALVGGSTLTLVKGALKLMAWTKMKTAALTGAAIILAAGTATVAVKVVQAARTPDITGAWIATMELGGWGVQAGEKPKTRVVFKVTKQNGSYQATGDSIDQGLKDLPASKFVYDYPSVHVEVDAVGYTFDGKMNKDATEFSGNWKQGADSGPLVFKRTSNPPAFPEPLADSDYAPRAGSDLQGFWQGFIGKGKGALGVKVKIAEPADGTFRADFYVPDQGGGRQPATIVYEKPTVKLFIMAGFGMFEGEFRNGNTEMVGNWIQGGRLTPTTFARTNIAPPEAFGGVGLVLDFDATSQALRITRVFPNSPAAEAELSAGMAIKNIDGVSIAGLTGADCINRIRGAVGTKVRLEVVTPDGSKTNTVELTRQKIKL